MRFWLAAAIGWTILIGGLCWIPRALVARASEESLLFQTPNFDKFVHAGIFAVMGILWLKASPPPKRFWPVLLGGLAWAVITELGQLAPVVNRRAGVDDALFDVLGLVAGAVAYYKLAPHLPAWNAGSAEPNSA